MVQRLRRLSQLGLASLVFPGAVANRFMHSIGVMHLAEKYGRSLFDLADPNTEYKIKVLRMAGLLHDIGHGPFSHTWDRTIYRRIYDHEKGHDQHRVKIITMSPFRQAIKASGINVSDILEAWTTEPYHSILQGPMGADRLDYMLRDAYFTGTQHFGTVALDRIINNAFISADKEHDPKRFPHGQLVFKSKIKDDVQRALEGRNYLYHNVYEHRTVKKFEDELENLINDAMEHGAPFLEYTTNLNKFDQLDECFLWGWFQFQAPIELQQRARAILERIKN